MNNSDTPETDHLENSLGPAAEQSHPALWLHARRLERERDEWYFKAHENFKFTLDARAERDEARELARQMSESNQVLLADVRFYRNAWEQLKKEKP
jgi:hypothetical protein